MDPLDLLRVFHETRLDDRLRDVDEPGGLRGKLAHALERRVGELGGVDPDPLVAAQGRLHEFRRLVPGPEHVERQRTLLGRLFLERGRRNLAAAVRGEPGAAAFEEAIRQARCVEERSVDVRLRRVEEDDQIEAIADVPVDATDAIAHADPGA